MQRIIQRLFPSGQSISSPGTTSQGDGTPGSDPHNQALEIWAAQIDASRQQMEDAVVSLSTRFAAIVDRLDSALRAGASSDTSAATKDAQRAEADLVEVVNSLKAIQKNRQALSHNVRSIVAYIGTQCPS